MPCLEGIDPADFESGFIDPADDPAPITTEVSIGDATMVTDPDGTMWVRFPVSVTEINYDQAISVRWDTANGTAIANTHYLPEVNQTLVIQGGESVGEIVVRVIARDANVIKYFYVNLSVPSNCTIADGQGKGDITKTGTVEPPPPGGPFYTDTSYTAYPKPTLDLIYAQFADCRYKAACTGFAGAAAMSALVKRKLNQAKKFNGKTLFSDAGGYVCTACTNCGVFSLAKVLKRCRDFGADLQDGSATYKIASFARMDSTTSTVASDIIKVKKALIANGVVPFGSPFWSEWNKCRAVDNYILRDQGGAPPTIGHAWIITGWNNNKGGGAFEVQSSHGSNWGDGGRGWMPYSYLTKKWGYYEVKWGGIV